jgi:translation initiation factor 6
VTKILQTNFYGDHNLGLFGKSSDKFCIIGNFIPEKIRKKVENVLKVRIIKASIANTELIGLFCCFNSNGILLPRIVIEREMENFKTIKKEFDLNLEILNSRYTALGNLILCNDKGAAISKNFTKKEKLKIEDCLGISSEYSTIARMNTVGSCGVATNNGCLLHRDVKEEEIKKIEEILKVSADIGTANFGSPFVGSCMIANSNGTVIGESTTGPEIVRVSEALNLI